jgi:translocation and assembly module TamB
MNWRKIVSWTLASLMALIAIGAIAGYFYLKSRSFREFALRKIIAEVDQSSGGRTQIRAFDFDLPTLTAHLYGIILRGKERPEAPPLLQIDKLTVGFKIQSVIRRQISLSELLIEHPAAHIQVDRRGNNLPQPTAQNASSSTNIFELAVGHVAISNGEIDYNDRKTPLNVDVHDLRTDVRFEFPAKCYRGSVSYDNGHIRYDEYTPLPHSFHASFAATPSLFQVESAVFTVGSSVVEIAGDVTNYAAPIGQGKYDIVVHAQDVAELIPTVRPAGDLALKGTFRYQNVIDQPFLRSVRIDGEVRTEVLAAKVSSGQLEVRNFRGQYQIADGSLQASGIEAEAAGGRVNANLRADHLDSTPTFRARAAVRGIALGAIQRTFGNPELKSVAIVGTLDGTTDASWSGSLSNARARADLVLRANGANRIVNQSARNIPVNGVIHALYDGPGNALTFHQTTLRIPATSFTAEGQVSKHSRLDIQANTTDLSQVVNLISMFHPSQAGMFLVSGSAAMNVTVLGSMRKPEISGHLNAQSLQVQGSEWKGADLSFHADASRIVVSNGSLTNARRGQVSFDVTIGLQDWAYLSSSPIQANLSLRQMQLADLQHLANVHYPISGELSAKVSMNGSQLDPRGSGFLAISNARAYDEPLKALTLSIRGDQGSVNSDFHLSCDAGSVDASLNYEPKTKAYKFRLKAPAIVLQKLHAVQDRNLAMDGTVAISANGDGTLDDPRLNASIQLPKLEVQQKSILGVKADVRVANQQADLTVDSQVAEASLRARGHIALTGDYQTDASIDTGALSLGVLWATFSNGVPEGFSGQTEVHATVKGPLKNATQLEAHLSIPTLTASYQSLQIAAASPIHADYAHSVITLQPAEIRGTGTSLRVQGSIPIGGATAPNLTAEGSIDAHIFRMVSPDLRSSGTIALNVRATGSAASPQVGGQVRLQDIAFATEAAPLGIDKLNGTLDLDSQGAHISNMTAQVGGGQVSLGGSISYRPIPRFDIAVKADSVRLRYPDGLRSVLEGNLAWVGTTNGSSLRGRVLVEALSFTPDFDLGTFGDQFSSNAAAPAAPGFADTINLQIALQSKDNLSATSSQISLEGSAALNVGGTAANPVITGRTDLTAGELFYRNVRYQLQRGIITFADPNETKANLDVSVATTVEQYNLTLNLRGPFDKLTTSYSSDPPLATADIINLIARGKTSAELAASSQSTDSMVASQAASQVSGSLQKLAGISSLQIDPMFGGSNQNPATRLAVQQRVTKNFLFTFSTDVSQPGAEIVQGDYQINKRWSVSVARDQLGGVLVDGRFHTKF